MWSYAVYNLRIPPKLFWRLTLRQYELLRQQHIDALAHREMVGAYTTSAVVNTSPYRPEEPLAPYHWMPNYRHRHQSRAQSPATPEQIEAKEAWDAAATELTAELKTFNDTGFVGPRLAALGYGEGEDGC